MRYKRVTKKKKLKNFNFVTFIPDPLCYNEKKNRRIFLHA